MEDYLFYVFDIKLEKEEIKETVKEKARKKVEELEESEDKIDATVNGSKK